MVVLALKLSIASIPMVSSPAYYVTPTPMRTNALHVAYLDGGSYSLEAFVAEYGEFEIHKISSSSVMSMHFAAAFTKLRVKLCAFRCSTFYT